MPRPSVQKHSRSFRYARVAIYGLLAVLLTWLIMRERSSLGAAVDAITQANLAWLGLGLLAMLASLPATALVYVNLSPKPLRFGRTVLVQTAGFCINKLLPSGSGAAGTSFLYLRANKVPGLQASSVVVLNNLLGFVGHFILFWLLIAVQPSALSSFQLKDDTMRTVIGLTIAGLVLLVGVGILLRERIGRYGKQFRGIMRPAAMIRALGASMLITASYVVSLYASAQAVGVHLTLTTAIIALSASVLATSVVPTPGGIGAAEAGAYGGLIALGVDAKAALASALLYRVCTFWMPLLVGSVAFTVVAKRGYLRTKK